jgi:hypothetical protein
VNIFYIFLKTYNIYKMSKFEIQQAIETGELQEIRTEIIRPLSGTNQTSATFLINNRGGSLDRKTTLVIPITCENPEDITRLSFLPINVGIASVLRSVSLVSNAGGVTIVSNENPGLWMALSNSFQAQEYREKVLKCRMGIFENYETANVGQQNVTALGATVFPVGKMAIKDMKVLNVTPQLGISSDPAYPVSNVGNIDSFGLPENDNYRIKSTSATTANLYLSLEQLFPKFNGLELPIHLIRDGVSLICQFNLNNTIPNENRILCATTNNLLGIKADNNTANNTPTTPLKATILFDELVLLADYLVSNNDDPISEQVLSPEGLTLNYGDLQWNNFFLRGTTTATEPRNYKRDTLQLGASNQIIRQMYMFNTPNTTNTLLPVKNSYGVNGAVTGGQQQYAYGKYDTINPLKNVYCSTPLSYLPDGEQIQIKINQNNIYPQRLRTDAEKMHELMVAYGAKWRMPQFTYDPRGCVTDEQDASVYTGCTAGVRFDKKSLLSTTSSIQGWSCSNLLNSMHVIGCNLQKPIMNEDGSLSRGNIPGSGLRVGPSPIIIEIDRLIPLGHANDDKNIQICCVVERTLNIKDGIISIIEN